MDADGSNVTRLTDDPEIDRFPSWSPDGSRIAFSTTRDGNSEIYLMDPDGSNPLRLTEDDGEDSEPAWLSDGSRIVFFSTRSGNGEIWSMNPDGTELVNLTNDPSFDSAPGTLLVPSGAPEKISFVSDRAGENLDVYTMDVDGSNPFRVTTEPADDFDSSWAGDGAMLVFDTNRNGNWDIYSVEAPGTNTVRLTTDPADDESPAWRPRL